MSKRLATLYIALAVAAVPAAASADIIKVGVIGALSGPFGQFGINWAEAIKAYQAVHGKTVKGHDVEVILRDVPDINPAAAKATAQELIIKEKVQYLAGFDFTPNAIAVGQLAQEAKMPAIVFNAPTSAVLSKSEYLVRTSYTLPQVAVPVAQYAAESNIKRVVTIVADYAPGLDAEAAFSQKFIAEGGEILSKVRIPVKATDFSPFLQAAKELRPDAIFMWFPGGPPATGVIRAYSDNGLAAAGIKLLGTGETYETDLQEVGNAALGVETGMFYSPTHPGEINAKFLRAIREIAPGTTVGYPHVAAFDGMHLIYTMIAATDGKRDGEKAIAAVKGLKWESPRGPAQIDAKSRDLLQNVYMRKVERALDGKLVNREFKTFDLQPDYGRQTKEPAAK